MPKDMPADIKIAVVEGKPVELPSGQFMAEAQMTREGLDLHMTSPDGHTVTVEGYFAHDPAPDLVTPEGGRMSPQLVDAFLPPEHVGQYAASGQITNDASPAGQISQVVGEATIVRADGTRIPATNGTPVFQGDVVETSKTGAVNITFADNTTFAISESARMSVDQFVYNSETHSGTSFFSMLQGMFVYTSGLIGKDDPGSVNIETPVGSIGIRGTVVAGTIAPAGSESKITILDGAITLTNGTGTQVMNNSFDTVALNGYHSQPETVHMDAQTFSATYHSVSTVAGDTYSHFSDGNTGAPPAANDAPAQDGGDKSVAPPPAGAAPAPADGAPVPPPAGAAPPVPPAGVPVPPAGTAPLPPAGMAPLPPAGAMPPVDGANAPLPPAGTAPVNGAMPGMMPPGTFMPGMYATGMPMPGMVGPAPGTTFTAAGTAATGTFGTTTTAANNYTGTAATQVYTAPAGGTYINGVFYQAGAIIPPPPTTATNTNYTPFNLGFNYAPFYNNAPNYPAAGPGVPEFAHQDTIVAHLNPNNFAPGAITFMAVVNGANMPQVVVPGVSTNGTDTTVANLLLTPNSAFEVNGNWDLIVKNPLVLSHYYNPNGINIDVTATDSLGNTAVTHIHLDIRDLSGGLQPHASSSINLSGTNADDFLISTATASSNITGGGGHDVIIGNDFINNITVSDDSFKLVDGGAGVDKLTLGVVSGTNIIMDFMTTAIAPPIKGIEEINLGTFGAGNYGNTVKLSVEDVFQMTEGGHTLHITAAPSMSQSHLFIDIAANATDYAGGGFQYFSGPMGGGTGTQVEFRGNYNGQQVTLIVHDATTGTAGAGQVQVHSA